MIWGIILGNEYLLAFKFFIILTVRFTLAVHLFSISNLSCICQSCLILTSLSFSRFDLSEIFTEIALIEQFAILTVYLQVLAIYFDLVDNAVNWTNLVNKSNSICSICSLPSMLATLPYSIRVINKLSPDFSFFFCSKDLKCCTEMFVLIFM